MGFSQGATVGVWLTGQKYEDVVNILGLSAAGYVPQLFSSHFPNPAVVFDLLRRSEAKGLVFDDSFKAQLEDCPVPIIPALTSIQLAERSQGATLGELPAVKPKDVAYIVHSSGTTSGTPKLIPASHAWVKVFAERKWAASMEQGASPTQNVLNSIGSMAHVGTLSSFLGAAHCGSCLLQPSSMGFSSEELVDMVQICGVNRLAVYATFLSEHLRKARNDPELLTILQSVRQILHTGVSLNAEDEKWAHDNHIPITTSYGTSETAPLLTSVLGDRPSDRLLQPVDGASGQMLPYNESSTSGPHLLEIVVPADAPDSPHSSFIADDGFYHTGDLFEEVEKERYAFRGRAGDWIKTLYGLVDTKTIEDGVRKYCGDIIHDAVVVGQDRPQAALVVEAEGDLSPEAQAKLATDIVQRMEQFNERLFPTERLTDPAKILVVEKGSLPRTKEKGNVRRNATEQLYVRQIDAMFA